MISDSPDTIIETPLEKALRECPDIEQRPDLILRLVDLLFLLADNRKIPAS